MNGDAGDGGRPPSYRLQVAASVTQYHACVVDPRPARAVHCPDLNACLVNEGRVDPVDCKAVHFGYAIPVSVVPLVDSPDLAELVFEPSVDCTPEALAYLLTHHPHAKMATAKHVHRGEPEDIAAIAKQISDHAEAIYQTWKSRGLAPAEILSCHSDASAADKFGTALTPNKHNNQQQQQQQQQQRVVQEKESPSINANNLEQLVNDFVVEDKARLAAAGRRALPSSIQFAVQKFEKPTGGSAVGSPVAVATTPVYKEKAGAVPTYRPAETIETVFPVELHQHVVAGDVTTAVQKRLNRRSGGDAEKKVANRRSGEVGFNHRPSDVVDAAQKTLNRRSTELAFGVDAESAAAAQQKKLNRRSSELVFPGVVDATGTGVVEQEVTEAARVRRSSEVVYRPHAERKLQHRRSAEYVDEVAREEERLINALKEGIVIAEEDKQRKSSLLLKKKSRDETSTSPTSPASDVSSLSLVDYAKVRYRAAQQASPTQQRLADARRLEREVAPADPGGNVEAARNRFEEAVEEDAPKRAKSAKKGGRAADGVPHPELTSLQRMRAAAHATAATNPIRPFLTRGSVAERVMIFEKCPTTELLEKRRTAPAIAAWRNGRDVLAKAQNYARDKSDSKPAPNTTLQRSVKSASSRERAGSAIPRFYFPRGKPQAENLDTIALQIQAAFAALPQQQATREKFHLITKACDLPLYWKVPLFVATGGAKLGYVEPETFMDFWKRMTAASHDEAARFAFVVTKGVRNYVLPEDLMALVQDVVDTHPGLTFLKEAVEFHSRYVHTVIARIFYSTNRSWSGRLNLSELRRGSLLPVLRLLESEDDINQVTTFFSYEHFYVIYCKFWELDRDHDLFIDKHDLQRHNDHALSSRMVDRIFSGAVTRGAQKRMSYTEFVWFLLSEEDKTHPTAVEYWFRCMDLDGDGYLSMYELEYFYEEQMQRLEAIGIETLPFQDCLCQMLDMIRPTERDKISLSDLRRCRMSAVFFDTFFNLEKYLEHEQRDPFAAQRDDDADISPWDRYAADEYEALVAEEGGGPGGDDMMTDDDCM